MRQLEHTIENLLPILSQVITDKYQPVIENTLNVIKSSKGVHHVALCKNEETLLTSEGLDLKLCLQKEQTSFLKSKIYKKIIPNGNYYISVLVSDFYDSTPFFVLILVITLIFSMAIVFRILISKIKTDIVDSFQTKNDSDVLIEEIVQYRKTMEDQKNLVIKEKLASNLYSISTQLAHDIRSPLAALDMVMKDTTELPEDKRLLIRHSVNRINDIANDLLNKNRPAITNSNIANVKTSDETSSQMLATVISNIITEKRFQYKTNSGIEISADFTQSYGLFSSINANSFRRVVSNIINNAVESIEKSGDVVIKLFSDEKLNIITIWNNGTPIPRNILEKLGTKGITDKQTGNGLGVFHAMEQIKSWGGAIKYQSSEEDGTLVAITLPKSELPKWFITELLIKPNSKIAIIDDDSSIHQVWKGRFASSEITDQIATINFFSPEEAIAKKDLLKDIDLFLIDYEFINSKMNGLDLIQILAIEAKAILVTSRFDESHIQNPAQKLKGMIPKSSAIYIPISSSKAETSSNKVILIDDDELMRLTWEVSIMQSEFEAFASADEFYSVASNISKNAHIFIDVHIGDVNGPDVADQIHKMGFSHLYLTTGYDKENISVPFYIKEVYSKKKPDWVK
jgi:signal transduction histidine kinase/FixJ family two-component response regulator